MDEKNKFLSAIKEKLIADKKVIILIICAVFAMLVLLLSGNGKAKESGTPPDEKTSSSVIADYELELSEKVKDLISAVNGAGNVKVLLTLECYEEYVYARDEEYFENKSSENSNIEQKKSYIVIDNDKLQEGVLIKIITPRVRGVGVVCDGGGSSVIKREITEILCAALDIGASQVHITN